MPCFPMPQVLGAEALNVPLLLLPPQIIPGGLAGGLFYALEDISALVKAADVSLEPSVSPCPLPPGPFEAMEDISALVKAAGASLKPNAPLPPPPRPV